MKSCLQFGLLSASIAHGLHSLSIPLSFYIISFFLSIRPSGINATSAHKRMHAHTAHAHTAHTYTHCTHTVHTHTLHTHCTPTYAHTAHTLYTHTAHTHTHTAHPHMHTLRTHTRTYAHTAHTHTHCAHTVHTLHTHCTHTHTHTVHTQTHGHTAHSCSGRSPQPEQVRWSWPLQVSPWGTRHTDTGAQWPPLTLILALRHFPSLLHLKEEKGTGALVTSQAAESSASLTVLTQPHNPSCITAKN